MVGACQSVHKRKKQDTLGNLKNFKVRLSNLIWENFESKLHVEAGMSYIVYRMAAPTLHNPNVSFGPRESILLEGDGRGYPFSRKLLEEGMWMHVAYKAAFVKILVQMNRNIFFVVEQPTSSWAFKCPFMLDVKDAAGMFMV